jgi:hypothetical protein
MSSHDEDAYDLIREPSGRLAVAPPPCVPCKRTCLGWWSAADRAQWVAAAETGSDDPCPPRCSEGSSVPADLHPAPVPEADGDRHG